MDFDPYQFLRSCLQRNRIKIYKGIGWGDPTPAKGGVHCLHRMQSFAIPNARSRLILCEAGLNFGICFKGGDCGDYKMIISFTDPFSATTPTKNLKLPLYICPVLKISCISISTHHQVFYCFWENWLETLLKGEIPLNGEFFNIFFTKFY